jgi:hypothetical protein
LTGFAKAGPPATRRAIWETADICRDGKYQSEVRDIEHSNPVEAAPTTTNSADTPGVGRHLLMHSKVAGANEKMEKRSRPFLKA